MVGLARRVVSLSVDVESFQSVGPLSLFEPFSHPLASNLWTPTTSLCLSVSDGIFLLLTLHLYHISSNSKLWSPPLFWGTSTSFFAILAVSPGQSERFIRGKKINTQSSIGICAWFWCSSGVINLRAGEKNKEAIQTNKHCEHVWLSLHSPHWNSELPQGTESFSEVHRWAPILQLKDTDFGLFVTRPF